MRGRDKRSAGRVGRRRGPPPRPGMPSAAMAAPVAPAAPDHATLVGAIMAGLFEADARIANDLSRRFGPFSTVEDANRVQNAMAVCHLMQALAQWRWTGMRGGGLRRMVEEVMAGDQIERDDARFDADLARIGLRMPPAGGEEGT